MTYIFLQIVGTATKERIPDVPMFSATPAKRPRRESLAETISAVGRTIVTALAPREGNSKDAEDPVEQVFKEV